METARRLQWTPPLGTKPHSARIAPLLCQSMRKRLDKRAVGWGGCAAVALYSISWPI